MRFLKPLYLGSLITFMCLSFSEAESLNIDMYQDKTDPKKTIVLIEKDGNVKAISVNNDDLDDEKTIEKLVEYGLQN